MSIDINTVWKIPRVDRVSYDTAKASLITQRRKILEYRTDIVSTPLTDYRFTPDYELVAQKIDSYVEANKPIYIWGDFDVDGASSTAALVYAFKQFNANVSYSQASRSGKGHGIDTDYIKAHAPAGALIITVDNGSNDIQPVEDLKAAGFEVIITDHHIVETPANCLILNPKMYCTEEEDEFMAPGVWVAARLAVYLASTRQWSHTLGKIFHFCSVMVGLGIMSDIIPLNALMFRQLTCSLAEMQWFKHSGWDALLSICYYSPGQPITSRYLSYVVIPKLNSAGRMGQADIAVRLLLAEGDTDEDRASAQSLALTLKTLNDERKLIEQDIYDQVVDRLFQLPEIPAGIVMYDPNWHLGVLGVVCSRLAEETGRPICLMGRDTHGVIKGSGRGGEAVDLYAALQASSDTLTGFGGHRAAAGMSVADESSVQEFQQAFSNAAAQQLSEYTIQLNVDAIVNVPIATSVQFQMFLENFQPIGKDNPAIHLLFKDLEVIDIREKRNTLHIYCIDESGGPITLTKFRANINTYTCIIGDKIDAIVVPVFNYFTGITLIEWEIKDLKKVVQDAG